MFVSKIWEDLTADQQEAFMKAVDSGRLADVGDVIQPWQPWWESSGAVLEHSPALPEPPEAPPGQTDAPGTNY